MPLPVAGGTTDTVGRFEPRRTSSTVVWAPAKECQTKLDPWSRRVNVMETEAGVTVTSPGSDLGSPAATACQSICLTGPDSCSSTGTVSDVRLPPRPPQAVDICAAGVCGDRAGGMWESLLKITPSKVTLDGRTDLGTGSRLVELIVRDFPEVNSIDQLQLSGSIADTPSTVCGIRGLSQCIEPKSARACCPLKGSEDEKASQETSGKLGTPERPGSARSHHGRQGEKSGSKAHQETSLSARSQYCGLSGLCYVHTGVDVHRTHGQQGEVSGSEADQEICTAPYAPQVIYFTQPMITTM